MPQAIQPGSYTAMYSQQLLQTLLMQATQMLAGQGGLTPQAPITNPALIATVDNALNSTVVSLDTQLASVGIGVSSGIPQVGTTAARPMAAPAPAAPAAKPAATLTGVRQADAGLLSLGSPSSLSALA